MGLMNLSLAADLYYTIQTTSLFSMTPLPPPMCTYFMDPPSNAFLLYGCPLVGRGRLQLRPLQAFPGVFGRRGGGNPL